MTGLFSFDRGRIGSFGAVLLVHLLVGWLLITGLRIDVMRAAGGALNVLSVREIPPEPPAPPPEPVAASAPEEEGTAAPPNLRSEASPVVAPEPAIVIPRTPTVIAAPSPNQGTDALQGAAEQAGPGTGAGGSGVGTGSGRGGDGTGGGGIANPARKVAGEIRERDYRGVVNRAGGEASVGANVTIDRAGRVTDCVVARSSGIADLDALTCRLIRERFRYEPARNAAGEPVASRRGWEQRWFLQRR